MAQSELHLEQVVTIVAPVTDLRDHARRERPPRIETGVVLSSADVLADRATLRAQGLDVDEHPTVRGHEGHARERWVRTFARLPQSSIEHHRR
jgi:hypothetical protein